MLPSYKKTLDVSRTLCMFCLLTLQFWKRPWAALSPVYLMISATVASLLRWKAISYSSITPTDKPTKLLMHFSANVPRIMLLERSEVFSNEVRSVGVADDQMVMRWLACYQWKLRYLSSFMADNNHKFPKHREQILTRIQAGYLEVFRCYVL